MLALHPWRRPLRTILAGPRLTAEEMITAGVIARPILRFREHYTVALIVMSGIVVPPHERLMLHMGMLGAPENINVSSRGTSKSTTVCVLGATEMAILYGKKKIVELSAVGFRGGQSLFNEIERWATGKWDSQEPGIDFVARSIEKGAATKALVHRAQNYWEIKFGSHTVMRTLPTNDEDRIRGERAHIVFIDEANTTEESLISRVVRPFLNVKGGFDTGGAEASSNMAFYTSTIDFAWRPFNATVQAARDGIRRDYEALQATRRGDWDTYQSLEKNGLLQYTVTSLDYTDTILREELTDRSGQRYKVHYPNANVAMGRPELEFRDMSRGIPFTVRDPEGRIQRDGLPCRVLTTYPIDKDGIERTLFDGSTEESIWLSEQRNVIDSAGGDVYPHGVVDKIAGVGNNCIVAWEDAGPEWQRRHKDEPDRGFNAPIMYECEDPCVMGVDVANASRDFAAFCVIRMGPLSTGKFDPLGTRSLGHTSWSNVVWQEQHRMMSPKDIANKIRQFRERYNLIWYHEPWRTDDWEWCRAIGIDDRGGGSSVRDELLMIDVKEDEELPEGAVRLYDPLDKEEKIGFLKHEAHKRAVPLLDMIAAQDTTNDKLVEFTLAQMKTGRLYLPKWLDESRRPDRDAKLEPGYIGARILEHQLRRLQQEPTARARKFFMPGDNEDAKNKKDAWASFIYAAKQLRAHLLRAQLITKRPPPQGALVSRINSARGTRGQYGRSPGGKL